MIASPFPQLESSARPRVLVVEDEKPVRDILARWLLSEQIDSVTAGDGEEAWNTLQNDNVDLITSDINMPKVSGLQLLARVVPAYPELAVLMLTGCGETSTAIQALTQGACGYLLKPVQREEFVCQVRQGLERTALRRERIRHTTELERRVVEQTAIIRTAHEETIHRLVTASRYRDEETGAHIRRTGLFSECVARAAGWSDAECGLIRMAAPMHDIGKIGIPDTILRKPGKLTAEEFEIMKRHTTIGAQMLEGSQSPILQLGRVIALEHHERWDGGGYPRGIKADAIHEAARILAIVDVYDALSHDRVYRPAMSEEETLRILQQGCGSHFDSRLLAVFFTVFDEIRALAAAHPDPVGEAPDIDARAAIAAGREQASPAVAAEAAQTQT